MGRLEVYLAGLDGQLFVIRPPRLVLGDHAVLSHLFEHVALAVFGLDGDAIVSARHVTPRRVVLRGRLHQAGNERCLGQVEVMR